MTEFGAAASSSSPSSSSFTDRWPYHVFLSFRGEDTRHGFIGHLYNALDKRGIRTFIDDEGIRKGEEITPTLLKTIEESKTAIVVFSKDYASSTFCLTELVHILDCMKGHNGRFIWPVFYDVDPSDIRHQKGSYKKAFDQYEGFKDETTVKRWRLALTEVANMSGWHFELSSKSYEYKIIEEITEVVSKDISIGPLHVVEFPVGLEFRVKEVCSLLNKQSHFDGATMVGICGIGGIGKTTIARAVYNEIASQFQYLCFLSNIKEKPIHDLQKRLLSKTLKQSEIELDYDKIGIPIIKDRFHNKKVLLILDDIDTLEQLNALAGESDWFGFGSKIIITTRDKRLLKRHEIESIYEVRELTYEEARELMILNAFKSKEVNPKYEKVIQRAVQYASGLPLALEILGSNLYKSQTVEEWKTALDIYEKIPDKTIQKILKVSYDGLEEIQREIFLDIACFYKGRKLDYAMEMLFASHGIDSKSYIRVLIDKSLIKIDGYGHLEMHDLIQHMGQEIVRQDSTFEAGERSRLWSNEDILHVLKENTGTGKIQGMINSFHYKKVEWSGEAFEKMKNIRVLCFSNDLQFSQGPKSLPNSLRVVDWDDYPSSTLPDDFCPINLVRLSLKHSRLKTLGKAFKNFYNLRKLDLSFSENLEEFSDISEVVNLEVLDVSYCEKLTKIDDSVGHLAKLRVLNARGCNRLDTFIVGGIKLVYLEILNLSNCSNLHTFPEILETMEKIKTVDLSYTVIKILPKSIEKLVALERLCLSKFKGSRQLHLKTLYLKGCIQLQEIRKIPPNIEVFSAHSCKSLTSSFIRASLKQNLYNLRELDLSSSENLEELPDISGVVNLEVLDVSYCEKLTKIDDSVGRLAKLRVLNATRCNKLDTFIVGGIKLAYLEILNLSNCSNLHMFPEILVTMEKIKTIDLSHTVIKLLPESIEKLVALERLCLSKLKDFRHLDLKTLYLNGCQQLQEIRKFPPNIEVFSAQSCKSLTSSFIRASLKQNFYHLRELDLSSSENLEKLPDISKVVNLEVLDVSYCKKLTKIDDSVGHLAKLRILSAKGCDKFHTFIIGGIKLVYLEILNLSNCSNLHTFPEILVTMEKIKTVDLSHTAITILPESIEKLVALERLCLGKFKDFHQLDLKTLYLNGCKQLQEIRKFPPNIEVFSVQNCKSLTSSFIRASLNQNLYNLRELNLQNSQCLEEIPNIFGAVNIKELNISYCEKLSKIDDSVGHLTKLRVLNALGCLRLNTFIAGGIKLVSLEILSLKKCSNLHTFPKILVTMEKIKTLDLSYTAIKTLPESIMNLVTLEALYLSCCKELHRLPNLACHNNLKTLDLNWCKELEEIRGIPPNIEVFFAQSCTSLTSSTRRQLLTQELQETRKTEFILPGNEIPKWLHKHSTGGSVSFWVRRKLPQIALCAVVTGGPTIFSSFVMHVNGVTENVVRHEKTKIEIDHIFLFDLGHFEKIVASKLLAKEWNHVKFSLEGGGTESRLKYIGVYVYNYDSCMEDILFENPIPQERIQVEAVHKIGDSESSSVYYDNNRDFRDNNEEDLQQQQQLTSINQQTSESFEIVEKAKGKGIIVHGGNANEEKDKNALEVTCQNCLRPSNNESLTWDPMIWEYGLTCQKDQSTVIDEGHDGCDPMEWEYQLTHPKDQSTIIGKDDKSKNQIMGPSTEVVSSARKKEINLNVDAVDGPSFSTTSETMRDLSLSDLHWQQHLSDINQQVSKSSENFKKAKGKNIIVYGDNTSEEKDSNTLEKDQSAINDKGHDETESHKARVTCFDLFSYLVSLCSSSAAS